MSKRVRILLGGILLALMSAHQGAAIYAMFAPPKGSDNGMRASWDGKGEPRITSVDPNGPAVGLLQAGDEMIAINGVKIRDNPRVLTDSDPVPPGTRETLTIRRAGELRDVTVQTVPHKFRIQFDPMAIVVLLFLLTAWVVFLLRPDDKQAWLLALMLATLTGLMGVGDRPADKLPSWWADVAGVARVLGTLALPIFVHFFLIFPETSPLLRRFTRLETWLYLPCLLVIFPALGPMRLSGELGLWLNQFRWFQQFVEAAVALIAVYFAAGLVCLALNYRAVGIITWKIASSLHDKYLAPLIDRRFFRQSYDAQQIIAELTQSLRTVTGLPHLLELVATKIQTALQTENVTIFLRDQTTGNYNSAYSCDYNETDVRAISRERHSLLPYYAGIVKQLSDNAEPLDFEQYAAVAQQESDNGRLRGIRQPGLRLDDNPISPISLISPIGEGRMTEDEMEALREVKGDVPGRGDPGYFHAERRGHLERHACALPLPSRKSQPVADCDSSAAVGIFAAGQRAPG